MKHSSLSLMEEMLLDVATFQTAFGLTIGDTPAVREAELSSKLLLEETQETIEALVAGDLVKAVDGVIDVMYVAAGILVRCGVYNLPAFWHAVHAANLAKAGGEVIDGKLRKPPGWVGPEADIVSELRNQGWDG